MNLAHSASELSRRNNGKKSRGTVGKTVLFLLRSQKSLCYTITMKIVVMSDSHSVDGNVEKVLRREKDADMFIHCGDLVSDRRRFPDLYVVRGNCDYDNQLPLVRYLDLEGVRAMVVHGHNIYDRIKSLAASANEHDCQLVFYGHTHVPADEVCYGVRLLNPGSLSYNRDRSKLGYLVINVSGTDYTVERKTL